MPCGHLLSRQALAAGSGVAPTPPCPWATRSLTLSVPTPRAGQVHAEPEYEEKATDKKAATKKATAKKATALKKPKLADKKAALAAKKAGVKESKKSTDKSAYLVRCRTHCARACRLPVSTQGF